MDPNTTFYLAAYGAVVSTASVVWAIVRDVRNRGRLRLRCYIGEMSRRESVNKRSPPLLVWEIVNTGTKPIILAHLGVSHFDGREGALGPSGPLPRPIQPGEKTEEYSTDLGILNDNLKSLWVQDTVGKTYRFPRRLLKKLIAGPREATKLMVV